MSGDGKDKPRRSSRVSNVDPALLEAIRTVAREELDNKLSGITSSLQNALTQLTTLNDKFSTLKKSSQDLRERVNAIATDFPPKLSDKMCCVSTALTVKVLDKEVHDRKWSLIISGFKGCSWNNVIETRKACIKLAKSHLKVSDADSTLITLVTG